MNLPISYQRAKVGIMALLALLVSGCYTIIITSQTPSSQYYEEGSVYTSFAGDLDYSNDCLSCHSQAELDDRYVDMKIAGIQTVHGASLDPYGWRRPQDGVPWWIEVIPPPPMPSIGTFGGAASSGSLIENQRRLTGASKGESEIRGTIPATASSPTSTPTAPGSSTPAVQSTTPSTPSTTTPATQERKSDSNPTVPKARTSGSTRGK